MKLADFLSQRAMSQTEFANSVGVTTASISRYISGDRLPSAAVMRKIREVTEGKVTPDDLVEPARPAKRRRAA
jgi:predicted transcriptional regulator